MRQAGVQHRAAIAQARGALAVEQMGVDAGGLLGGVGAHAQRSTGKLVHELEGLQFQIFTRSGEQRFDVLHQWGDHQFVAVAASGVEQLAPQIFDQPRLGGQYIGNVVGQYPGGHGAVLEAVKAKILQDKKWSAGFKAPHQARQHGSPTGWGIE